MVKGVFSYCVLVLVVFGCYKTNKVSLVVDYLDRRQVLNINKTNEFGKPIKPIQLLTTGPDSVQAYKQVQYKAFFDDPKFKLIRAYFHCHVDSKSSIDTINYKLNNCSKELMVENDTIYISFKPTPLGQKEFLEMIAISLDEKGYARYHKGTFNYFVME